MPKIALVQFAPTTDVLDNVRRSAAYLDEAAAAGANVVAFPEIQLSPFFPQYAGGDATRYEVTLDGDAIAVLRRRCRDLSLAAFPNVYLRLDGKRYDATVAIGPTGDVLGVSKMVHVVRVPRFYEQDYYAPSDGGFHVYHTPFGCVGVVICFDRHFPESFRSCVLQGAELTVVPTVNTVDEPLDVFEWEMRVAAFQNGVYVAMCNRVGREGAMDFCGGSIVAGPDGEIVARADGGNGILYADLDLGRIPREREARPYLDLRRPEADGTGASGP